MEGEVMQRDLWTREDLRNALVAAFYAGVATAQDGSDEERRHFNQGFSAALTTLALNFGLGAFPLPQRKPAFEHPSTPFAGPGGPSR